MIFVSNKDTMNLIFVSSGEPDRWHNQGGDATEGPAGKPGKGIFIIIKKQGAFREKIKLQILYKFFYCFCGDDNIYYCVSGFYLRQCVSIRRKAGIK